MEAGARDSAAHALPAPAGAAGGEAARRDRAASGVPLPRACANVAVPRRSRRGAGSLDDRGGPLLPMKSRLPLLELLLCALCLWAGWYHTPAGALVRSVGAWLFGTRSTARPLLAYFGAGTLVPPRIPPMLPGPVPPAQALAYGAAAVLDASPLEVGPRLRATAQRLGSDDAALLAMFCGEEAARYALDEARSPALDDLARALPPRSEACVGRAAQAAMLGGAYALGWPLPEWVRITSAFGVREHPLLGGPRFHAGIDLGTAVGTPVRAAGTCKEMGIGTVAIYSDADRAALHVRSCDEAVRVGPPPSRESYLVIDNVIAACKATGADAVHPGYGFLSENAKFARACASAGITFIGPPPEAMEEMGEKTRARRKAIEAGVPVVPGLKEPIPEGGESAAKDSARSIGYPIMLKAAAGGGGKGMRLVTDPKDFDSGLATARREALGAFGDGRVSIEKAVARPRHIEIQIFADAHGNCIWLGERECSVQRRHQKVIEETPSALATPELRAQMGTVAVK